MIVRALDRDYKTFGYIYKTVNNLNNKTYVGQRQGEFDPKYLGSGIILKKAIKKYGVKNFKLSIIAWAKSEKEIDNLEIEFIKVYKSKLGKVNSYNINKGGKGFRGKHTLKSRKLISLHSARLSGIMNPSYIDGRSSKYSKCMICGIEISHKAARCRSCNGKYRKGLLSPLAGKKPWNYRINSESRECLYCKKSFTVPKKSTQRFCSHHCCASFQWREYYNT